MSCWYFISSGSPYVYITTSVHFRIRFVKVNGSLLSQASSSYCTILCRISLWSFRSYYVSWENAEISQILMPKGTTDLYSFNSLDVCARSMGLSTVDTMRLSHTVISLVVSRNLQLISLSKIWIFVNLVEHTSTNS